MLIAEVVNHGDRPTTITHLVFVYYRNMWNRLRNRADQNMAILLPNTRQPIPFELRPGSSWSGFAIQDHQTMEKHSKTLEERWLARVTCSVAFIIAIARSSSDAEL